MYFASKDANGMILRTYAGRPLLVTAVLSIFVAIIEVSHLRQSNQYLWTNDGNVNHFALKEENVDKCLTYVNSGGWMEGKCEFLLS